MTLEKLEVKISPTTLWYVFNLYTSNLFVAVVCPDAPEKPRGGKWFWSDKNKNGTFGTTIDYECGPYAKFQAPNTTDFYQKTSSSCQWDKTWTKSKLDPCICKYTYSSMVTVVEFHSEAGEIQ